MSYDLMVFEKTKAPREKEAFLAWYHQVTEWEEGHSYEDAAVSSRSLQSWYHEMRQHFPAMNGPDGATEEEIDAEEIEESRLSDYCIARDAIYVAFAWSQADNAYETMRLLAQKHEVGFFNVSGNGEIVFPKD